MRLLFWLAAVILDSAEGLSNMFIILSDFAPVARAEANGTIPQPEIDALKKELALNKLWTISRFGGLTDFMLYTDKQVEQFKANGMHERLSHTYYDIFNLMMNSIILTTIPML